MRECALCSRIHAGADSISQILEVLPEPAAWRSLQVFSHHLRVSDHDPF